MLYLSVVTRKTVHSLSIEGDESCPLSTLQVIAILYDHPATSVTKKGPMHVKTW